MCGVVWCGVVCGVVWCDVMCSVVCGVWCGVVWCGWCHFVSCRNVVVRTSESQSGFSYSCCFSTSRRFRSFPVVPVHSTVKHV